MTFSYRTQLQITKFLRKKKFKPNKQQIKLNKKSNKSFYKTFDSFHNNNSNNFKSLTQEPFFFKLSCLLMRKGVKSKSDKIFQQSVKNFNYSLGGCSVNFFLVGLSNLLGLVDARKKVLGSKRRKSSSKVLYTPIFLTKNSAIARAARFIVNGSFKRLAFYSIWMSLSDELFQAAKKKGFGIENLCYATRLFERNERFLQYRWAKKKMLLYKVPKTLKNQLRPTKFDVASLVKQKSKEYL